MKQGRSNDELQNKLASCLFRKKDEIINSWGQRVLDDPAIEKAQELDESELIDHIPDFINSLVSALRDNKSEIASIEQCEKVGEGQASKIHALTRCQHGYAVPELIRELAHLRTAILDTCYSEVPYSQSNELLHTSIDLAMAEVADELHRHILREQKSLHETREIFEAMMEGSSDYAIFMCDISGRIETWNKGVERVLGFNEKELLGKSVALIFTPEDRAKGEAENELQRAAETGTSEDVRWHMRKDGARIWIDGVLTSLKDENGNLRGFIKIMRDATERKLSEERLKKSEEQLRQLAQKSEQQARTFDTVLSSHTDFMYLLDTQHRFIYANKSLLDLWGKPLNKVVGMTFEELGYPKHLVNLHKAQLELVINEQKPVRGENSFTSKGSRYYEYIFVPVLNKDGDVTAIAGTTRDITDRKNTEEELKAAKEAAESANRAKSSFLANMSHEIRTPLGAILGFAELLREHDLERSERLQYVDTIVRNSHQLGVLINDVLDLSKVEAGKLEVEKLKVSVPKLIEDVTETLSIKAKQKGIELNVESDGNIPDTIDSDPMRLRQILINIIDNAIKFTSKGSVTVRSELHIKGEEQHLAFIITDTGRGISVKERGKLFQTFVQADDSTTRRYGGTGLGLRLSRELARLLGGDVVLEESSPGKGSTFIITIDPYPAGNHGLNLDDEQEDSQPQRRDHRLSGVKVLLAEDSPDNRELIKLLLAKNGVEVEAVDNGADAVTHAMQDDFDLILMDVQMPQLDGHEATAELRRQGYKKPIIALTAHAMSEELGKSMKAGCNYHLTKPVSEKTLVSALHRHIGKKR